MTSSRILKSIDYDLLDTLNQISSDHQEDVILADYSPSDLIKSLKIDWNSEEEESEIEGHWSRIPGLFKNQAVFIPENFSPGYSYPLIITLTENESSSEIHPNISRQNYLGLRINLNELRLKHSFRESFIVHDVIQELLSDFEQLFKFNSRKIYLLAEGKLVSLALSLMLKYPEVYSGSLLVNPELSIMLSLDINQASFNMLTVGLIDEDIQPSSMTQNLIAQLRSLSLKRFAVFHYDDLMVHYNEFEVFNRLIMSEMKKVVW